MTERTRFPLPEPVGIVWVDGRPHHTYTAAQMHAYSDAECASLREQLTLAETVRASQVAGAVQAAEKLKAQIERLTRELANERASGVHSCHDGCTRAGCVNGRLRTEIHRLTAERDAATQASKWEADLCGQALEERNASETKHAILVDEFEVVRKERDQLREYLDAAQRRAGALGEEVAGLRPDAEAYRSMGGKTK